ncbi:MAG: hypothetical protein EPO26_17065 [Chloroflexota bacterium]|nr:MAG: hypothetical protein EPO26_17065 [Chloroflexota bacterium]
MTRRVEAAAARSGDRDGSAALRSVVGRVTLARVSRRTLFQITATIALYPTLVACQSANSTGRATIPIESDRIVPQEAVSTAVQSFGQASAAAIQAIVTVNTALFTDRVATPYDVWQSRMVQAIAALDVLSRASEQTERAFDSFAAGKPAGLASIAAMASGQAKPDQDRVRAVLNSADTKRPIAALMKEFGVSSKRAMVMLRTAMDQETADAYGEEAATQDRHLRTLTLVKEGAALAVNLGATAMTAGVGAVGVKAAAMTATQIGGATIEGLNGLVKTGIAGYELYVGQDVELSGKTGMVVNGLSAAADIVAIQSAAGLFTGAKIIRAPNAPLNTMPLPKFSVARADPSEAGRTGFLDLLKTARNTAGRIKDGVAKYGEDVYAYAGKVVPSELGRLVRQEYLQAVTPFALPGTRGEAVDKMMFLTGKVIDFAMEGKLTGGNNEIDIGSGIAAYLDPTNDRGLKPIPNEKTLPPGSYAVPGQNSIVRVRSDGISPIIAGTIGASLPPALVQPTVRAALTGAAIAEARIAMSGTASKPGATAAGTTKPSSSTGAPGSAKPTAGSGTTTAGASPTRDPRTPTSGASPTRDPRTPTAGTTPTRDPRTPTAGTTPTASRTTPTTAPATPTATNRTPTVAARTPTASPPTPTVVIARTFDAHFSGTSRAEQIREGKGETGTASSQGNMNFTITGATVSGTWSGDGDAGTLSGSFANGRITGTWSGHFGKATASGSWSGNVSPDGGVAGTLSGTYNFGTGKATDRGTMSASWSGSGTPLAPPTAVAAATASGFTGDIGGMVEKKLADIAAGRADKTSYATQYQGEIVQVKVDPAGNPYLETNSGKQTRLNKDGTLAEPFKK